jgi:hypothetical protein
MKLAASGVRFQESASTNATAQRRRGCQRRSESVRIAIGAARKRRRAMFSPTGDETAKAAVQATK